MLLQVLPQAASFFVRIASVFNSGAYFFPNFSFVFQYFNFIYSFINNLFAFLRSLSNTIPFVLLRLLFAFFFQPPLPSPLWTHSISAWFRISIFQINRRINAQSFYQNQLSYREMAASFIGRRLHSLPHVRLNKM